MRDENAVDKYVKIDPKTRMFHPNWLYRDIMPYALGPDPSIILPFSNIAITGTDPLAVPFKLPHSSVSMDGGLGNPLQIDQIVFDDSDNFSTTRDFTVFITDQGDQRQFMNYPCHIRTIAGGRPIVAAGGGLLSARLSEDLFLPTRHQLMVTFQKTTGAENGALYFNFLGKIYYTWSSNLQSHPEDHAAMQVLINKWLERRKYVSPYWMTTVNGALTVQANQTVEAHAQIGDEGHFEATHILRAFTSGDATASPFEVSITNAQTRQSIMNGSIHSFMIGDALNPQPLPAPLLMPAGQLIRFKVKDLSGSTNTVFLTLRGRKWRCPIKDIAQIKREFGVGVNITDGLPQPSGAAEMQGVNG